jgi:anti-sigma regulatory factor (Ser/Thr protein kinase)
MYRLLAQVVGEDREPVDSEIIFDFRSLGFIRPEGYVVLANLVEWLGHNETSCRFRYPPPGKSEPVNYLDDSQFFANYLGGPLDDSSSPRDTTVALQQVASQQSYGWLDNQFVPWLANRLNMTEESFSSIKACLLEIFNNIDDHAGEGIEVGCFFAQQYPEEDRVLVAVSDFGVGIPPNVREAEDPSFSDGDAILRATDEGFTSQSHPDNRGAGLNTLLREVIDNNGGELYIHSNRGIVSCSEDGDGSVQRTPEEATGVYPGTLISISFRTDTIENISEEEFLW